ncbi:hypothetical protein H8D85_02670 [bacterium]|jgi:hypothetical protein|nr:hypothetical protein [bacterium]
MPSEGQTQKPAGKANIIKTPKVKNIPLPGLVMPVYKGNAVLRANK